VHCLTERVELYLGVIKSASFPAAMDFYHAGNIQGGPGRMAGSVCAPMPQKNATAANPELWSALALSTI